MYSVDTVIRAVYEAISRPDRIELTRNDINYYLRSLDLSQRRVMEGFLDEISTNKGDKNALDRIRADLDRWITEEYGSLDV